MRKKIGYAVLLLALMVFAWPLPAQAGALPDGKVIMGGSYTLASGQVLNDDLVIFGGSVTIEDGAAVQGDVALFGGTLDVSGSVRGDIAAFGGSITLNDTASVGGDLVTFGAQLSRAPGAFVGGQVVEGESVPFNFNFSRSVPFGGDFSERPTSPLEMAGRIVFGGLWFLFKVLALSALAVLALMFLEGPMERVAHVVVEQPALSGGVGCLTLMVAPILLLAIAFTIILLPVSFLGILALMLLALYGWIALGYELGRRVAQSFGQTWAAPLAAGVGTFLISLVFGGMGKVIPCVGWAIPWVAAGLGLGAVILTQLGTQDYPPSGGAVIPGVAQPPESESAPPPPPEEGEPPEA